MSYLLSLPPVHPPYPMAVSLLKGNSAPATPLRRYSQLPRSDACLSLKLINLDLQEHRNLWHNPGMSLYFPISFLSLKCLYSLILWCMPHILKDLNQVLSKEFTSFLLNHKHLSYNWFNPVPAQHTAPIIPIRLSDKRKERKKLQTSLSQCLAHANCSLKFVKWSEFCYMWPLRV